MLESLHIRNLALVEELDIEFGPGLNTVTGETGAGKSVILESVKLLLGGKADRELIRYGEESAAVSAVFGSLGAAAENALASSGVELDEDGSVQIRRTVSGDGKSRAWINGQPVSLSLLRFKLLMQLAE